MRLSRFTIQRVSDKKKIPTAITAPLGMYDKKETTDEDLRRRYFDQSKRTTGGRAAPFR